MSCRGFTTIELVVVILVLGIITTIAVPLLFDIGSFSQRAFYDEVVAATRYAQKLAVASGCEVRVRIQGDSYQLQQHRDSCQTGPFTLLSDHPFTSGSQAGVSLGSVPVNFTFDAMGRSSDAATVTVDSYSFTVVAETGYVDANN